MCYIVKKIMNHNIIPATENFITSPHIFKSGKLDQENHISIKETATKPQLLLSSLIQCYRYILCS